MAPHPCLRAAKPPNRNFFSRTQQACEYHAGRANNSERKPDRAAAARPRRGASGVDDVNGRRDAQTHKRHGQPSSMCAVDTQECLHFLSRLETLNAAKSCPQPVATSRQRIFAAPLCELRRAGKRKRSLAPRSRNKGRKKSPSA